jgi:hypothetical protein
LRKACETGEKVLQAAFAKIRRGNSGSPARTKKLNSNETTKTSCGFLVIGGFSLIHQILPPAVAVGEAWLPARRK